MSISNFVSSFIKKQYQNRAKLTTNRFRADNKNAPIDYCPKYGHTVYNN